MTESILMIDDSEDDLRLYRRSLKDMGYELETSSNADMGLATALAIKPCLILLDYKLPDMDGLEFIKRLNENSVIEIPVIMLTGEGSEPVAVEAMKMGVNDYVVKDTAGGFLRLLPSVIRRVLNSHAEKLATRKLKSLHQTILHTVADGVIGIDNDGVVLFANQSAERMLLSPPDGLIGHEVAQLLRPDGNQSDWSNHPLAIATKEITNLCRDSDFLRRENGELFPVSYTASHLDINDEHNNGWVLVFQDITARKKEFNIAMEAKATLEESEIKYRQLFESSSDGIFLQDATGIFIDCNDNGARLFGLSKAELIGRSPAYFSPERQSDGRLSAEVAGEKFAAALNGIPQRFEFNMLRAEGVLFDAMVILNRIEMHGSYYVHVVARDITERKLAEKKLRQQKQFSDDIIESLPGIFYMLNSKMQFVRANRQFIKVSGYSKDELDNKTALDFFEGNDRNLIAQKIQKVFEIGDAWAEADFIIRSGQKIPHYFTGHRTNIDNQYYLIGLGIDITERKVAEQALRESEERWHFAIDGSGDGVWDWNLETGRIVFSERYLEMLGYAGNVNWDCLDDWKSQVAAEEMQQAMVMLEAYLDGKVPTYGTEYRMQRADGGWAWILARGKVVSRAADGRPLRLIGTHTDITERKQSEEALQVAAVAFETHDAIMITDARANIIRVNQAFIDITGYSPEEVLGHNPRIMSSGRQDKAFYIEMWQQLLHTSSWAGEIWDKRKNGQIYPKWLTITAVKNERYEATHYVAIFSDITARKQAEDEIRNLAFYDSLTRLPNRRLFLDRFRAALTISTRRNDYGAVLFIDLDRFKTLNDTLGHDYGDLLLIEVAARIKSCVREMDTVARLGGDEFVVLIEGINEDQDETSRKVGLIAESIRETLAHPYQLKSHEHHSSPSIGISLYRGNENSVDELLQQADMAMYQAKNSGRNAVRFFDPVLQHNVASRAALENDLHHAIAHDQLQLHYQVQVDSEHRPLGAEALLRWFHPERGLVMPGEFIPIAEESSLILDIGHWVLDQACGQLALWAGDERMRDLTLAVNVSSRQFAQPGFVLQVADAMRSHRIVPSSLKLELTESMVLHDLKSTIDKMHALKRLGVKLSMDDFGTGYSSLSYLRDLPLDQIKIDQSFIQNITRDGNDALLVQAIIDLGGNFRMNVIAEGVETEAQLTFLKHHDCMNYQGFLFSKPVPIEEFEKLLGGM
ncbi:MAG: PAS domain S-box protein [Gallionellaceae bacterium]|jgi:diguanylate cyclase (GGDEF)-like protein/PAS domain S-box-containing protein